MTNGDGLVIRKAQREDVSRMLEIYAPYVHDTAVTFEYEPPTPEEFYKRFETTTAQYPWLVAELESDIVGFAYASNFRNREAYRLDVETTIYVDDALRSRGIGRALYRVLEDELRNRGIVNLYACVATSPVPDEHLTDASARFHERLGFRPVGTFPRCGMKFDTWYGITWYAKSLDPKADSSAHANRPMRRAKQQLPGKEAWNLLRSHLAGVLSVVDADGNPYGVPLNYAVMGSDIVFHGALEGRKIDAIRAGSRGSLCVVAQDIPVAETFSNDYVSVIAEGTLEVVSDEDARHDLLMALGASVNPDPEACKAEVAKDIARCAVFVLHVEHISAKESLALSRWRRMESAR